MKPIVRKSHFMNLPVMPSGRSPVGRSCHPWKFWKRKRTGWPLPKTHNTKHTRLPAPNRGNCKLYWPMFSRCSVSNRNIPPPKNGTKELPDFQRTKKMGKEHTVSVGSFPDSSLSAIFFLCDFQATPFILVNFFWWSFSDLYLTTIRATFHIFVGDEGVSAGFTSEKAFC